AALGRDKEARQAREVLKWVWGQRNQIEKKTPQQFSWRDLRHGFRKRLESGALSEEDLAQALDLLQRHGYLEEVGPQQAGRKAANARSIYLVNPKTWDQRDQRDQRQPGEDDPDPADPG